MMHVGCRRKKRRIGQGGGMGKKLAGIVIALKAHRTATDGAEMTADAGRTFITCGRFSGPTPLCVFQAQKANHGRA